MQKIKQEISQLYEVPVPHLEVIYYSDVSAEDFVVFLWDSCQLLVVLPSRVHEFGGVASERSTVTVALLSGRGCLLKVCYNFFSSFNNRLEENLFSWAY